MSLLAPDCKIRGKSRGHALELDVDEGNFAARRKAVGLAEFLAVDGLLRAPSRLDLRLLVCCCVALLTYGGLLAAGRCWIAR